MCRCWLSYDFSFLVSAVCINHIDSFFLLPPLFQTLLQGANNVAEWKSDKAAWVAGAASGGAMLLVVAVGLPLLHHHFEKEDSKMCVRDDADLGSGSTGG